MLKGLGITSPIQTTVPVSATVKPVTLTPAIPTPQTSLWDKIKNMSSTVITAGADLAQTVGVFKSDASVPAAYSSGPSTIKSNTKWYFIGGGVLAAAVITAVVLKKRKKKKSLGSVVVKKRRTKKRA